MKVKTNEKIDSIDILIITEALEKNITSTDLAKKYKDLFGKDIKSLDAFFRERLKRLKNFGLLKEVKDYSKKGRSYMATNNVDVGKVVISFVSNNKNYVINFENGLVIRHKDRVLIFAI